MPRTLYFDLDGTVVQRGFGHVKPRLADGQLEDAVRAAGFERLVCVANMCTIVSTLLDMGRDDVDGPVWIFQLCQGAFRDLKWFHSMTTLIRDGTTRAQFIDFGGDWWWVDDRATYYLDSAELMRRAEGSPTRVMIPTPEGDGADMIEWFDAIARTAARTEP
jgi:hypothetical protein